MQITIAAAEHARVTEKAAAQGISIAEYVRRLIRRDLGDNAGPAPADVSELFGLGDSGGSDIGTQKRQLIAEAVSADKADRGRGR